VFILEGVVPLLMGLVTLWYLTDRPQEAHWLPEDQKQWLLDELQAEEVRKTSEGHVRVQDALRHPQTFLLIAVFFLIVTGNQALIIFLPSITDGMKGMPVTIRTMAAALPYVCSAMGILINGMWAHRTGELRWHTALPVLGTGVSLALTVLAGDHLWWMMGLFCLAGFTSQAYLAPFFTLPTAVLGKSAAATAVGLICLGNLGGFVGPWLFGRLKDVTGRYDSGLWVLAGCMLLAGSLATMIRVPRNAHRESGEQVANANRAG
jgi:MFS transporter, ACS family, tartrate transporter